MYAVTVTMGGRRGSWSVSRTLPTFYLDENVQGIVDESHAWRIALDIVDPFEARKTDPTLTIDCTIVGPELTAVDLGWQRDPFQTHERCYDCLDHPGWAHGDESRRREPDDVCRACLGSGVRQG